MSIKGRPYTWMIASLKRGDLTTALAEAHEIPTLSLADALAIVVLMSAEQHPAFDRAAARWVARLVLERRLGLEDVRFALAAITALPHHPELAKRQLADICARHNLQPVIGLSAPEEAPAPSGQTEPLR